MFFGGMAGLSGWCSGFILDNIKSRIQTDSFDQPRYKSLPDTIRQLSVRDIAKGFVPGFVRGFPVNAATFLAYETAQKQFSKILKII